MLQALRDWLYQKTTEAYYSAPEVVSDMSTRISTLSRAILTQSYAYFFSAQMPPSEDLTFLVMPREVQQTNVLMTPDEEEHSEEF